MRTLMMALSEGWSDGSIAFSFFAYFCSAIMPLCWHLCSTLTSLSLLCASPSSAKLLPVSEGVTTTKEVRGCWSTSGRMWGEVYPSRRHRITTTLLVAQTEFLNNTCLWPVLPPISHRKPEGPFSFFCALQRLNTNYRVSLSLRSVLPAQREGASQAVVDANVDHISGEEEDRDVATK